MLSSYSGPRCVEKKLSEGIIELAAMGFGDLKTSAGLSALNDYLTDKSYVEGYGPKSRRVCMC